MRCVFLAAGYGSRLSPDTDTFPKPLLAIRRGNTILDFLIDDISNNTDITRFSVVSNSVFRLYYEVWSRRKSQDIVIIDDLTENRDSKLGEAGDLSFAIGSLGEDDDLLVVPSDSVYDFSLGELVRFAADRGTSCVIKYYEQSKKVLRSEIVVHTDGNGLLTKYEKSPEEPDGHWGIVPVCVLKREDLHLVAEGLSEGCDADDLRGLIAWISGRVPVHAMEMPDRRYPITHRRNFETALNEYKRHKMED